MRSYASLTGIPPGRRLLDDVFLAARPDGFALALYGSQARGTALPDSDVDVLQLVSERPGSYSKGNINIAAYLPGTLRVMAERGSLFILHLRMDAHIVSDPTGQLSDILDAYRAPSDYGRLFAELRVASAALDDVVDTMKYHDRLRQLGIYLVRTALYARMAEAKRPTFDALQAARRIPGGVVTSALEIRHRAPDMANDLRLLRLALADLLGSLPDNPWGSVEALAVGISRSNSYAASLLTQSLFASQPGLEYTVLTPPPL
jgi:Nucleotidyltransferase domain